MFMNEHINPNPKNRLKKKGSRMNVAVNWKKMHLRRYVEVCLNDQSKLEGAFRMHSQSLMLKLGLPEFNER
jgi:hypothetical protein